MERFRRHPVLWLSAYFAGLTALLALGVDWFWEGVSR
jgi:hypothetical protein